MKLIKPWVLVQGFTVANVKSLCCLMTLGFSKNIQWHVRPYFFPLCLQMPKSDIRPHVKWAVSLVIAHGHYNLPQQFAWVPYMG